jgi:hypothetical protein
MDQPTDPALHEALRLSLEVTDLLRWVRDEQEAGRVTAARGALPVLLATMGRLYFSWPLLVAALQEREPGEPGAESRRQLLLTLRCFRDQADAHCEQQTSLVQQHLERLKGGGA